MLIELNIIAPTGFEPMSAGSEPAILDHCLNSWVSMNFPRSFLDDGAVR